MVEVGGTCDKSFIAVRDAFRANFDAGEIGAACCVTVGDRVVVDVWGGWADEGRTRPWTRDTLVDVYSVGKPIIALALLQRIAAGDVELDAPADRSWPQLVAGRAGATVRHVLSHRAGVPAIREPLPNDAMWDWDRMCAAVAATQPWWQPGTRHAYHTNTYGHLVGELARRAGAARPSRWLRDEIAGPLGADVAWSLDAGAQTRCADIVWESNVTANAGVVVPADAPDEQRMIALSYFNPPGYSSIGVVNTSEWRAAEVPSTNLHATAHGVARIYRALAAGGSIDGVTVLPNDVLTEATRPQSDGWCPILEREATFGLGFQPTRPDRPFGPNIGSFGHYGTGGALGFADPMARIGFGYVMNAVKPRWQNPRNRALVEALYSCV